MIINLIADVHHDNNRTKQNHKISVHVLRC
jgi:hypothetical protein